MALTEHSRPAARPDMRQTALLAAGDALVFFVFAAIGRASHGEASGLAALGQVLETAAPFAAGWFAAAPFAKLYRPEIAGRLRPTMGRAALAWLAGLPVGMALRMLVRQEGLPPASFFITSYLFVLLFLGVWRSLYVWLAGKRGPA